MWPHSKEFADALTRSHAMVTAGKLYLDGRLTVDNLKIIAGEVRVDRTAAVRRSCTVTIADCNDLIPTATRRTAADPYGAELALWRGIRLPGGDEMIPLGVFRITGSELVDDPREGLSLQLSGYDRSWIISGAKWEQPYWLTASTNLITAITAIINDRLPDNPIINTTADVTYTVPTQMLDEDSDPWEEVATLASAGGLECFFAADGSVIIQEVPDPSTSPIHFEYVEGDNAYGKFTTIGRSYDSADSHNAVIITSESVSQLPVRGTAYDSDLSSPTYYFGRFGKRPTWEQNPLAADGTQANKIAYARMRGLVGLSERITFTAVPNPAHEGGDVVRLVRGRGYFHDSALLESFTIPLTAEGGLMPVTCRTRRVPPG